MGRFRTLAINNEINYNDLYIKKKGIELIKNARTHCSDNYKINDKFFYNFKNYETYYTIANAYPHLNTECIKCEDSPLNLSDGLNSEICYNEIFKDNDIEHPCIDLKVLNLKCRPDCGSLYPYGKFNNRNSGRISYLHNKMDPNKCNKLQCQPYEYCRCDKRCEKHQDKCSKCDKSGEKHKGKCSKCDKSDENHKGKCSKCDKHECCCVYSDVFPTNQKMFFQTKTLDDEICKKNENCKKKIHKSSNLDIKEDIIESFSRFSFSPRKKHVKKENVRKILWRSERNQKNDPL